MPIDVPMKKLIIVFLLIISGLACSGGQIPGETASGLAKVSTSGVDGKPISEKDDSSLSADEKSNTAEAPSLGRRITEEVTEQAPTPKVKLKPFNPLEDGFGFTNFSGGSGPSSILVNDLVDLFGSDGLCIPGKPEECEPYPGVQLFLEQLNGVLANGLCYGISASVTNHFSGNVVLDGIGSETKSVVDLSRSDALDHFIARLHMMQFSEEYREVLDTYLEARPTDIAQELKGLFENVKTGLNPPYTLGLYSDMGGHAVTPIGIEETEDGYRVHVYDSNWPKETRWVDIVGNSWEYQGSAVLITEDNDSKDGLWKGEGSGSMALLPHDLPDDRFNCFFCQKTNLGLSNSTGSVIMVNAEDIKNTAFEIASDDGQTMTWTTKGRSSGLDQVKTYILPSANEPSGTGSDILMVFIPAEVDSYEVNLSPINNSGKDVDQDDSFELVLVGPGIPTTVTKGHILDEDISTSIIKFSKDPSTKTVILAVDSKKVGTIESATIQSTTFVELSDDERYEAIVIEDALSDVIVVQRETEEVVFSLKAILHDVETPLKTTDTGDGLRFSKLLDGSVTVESPDNDVISKAVGAGYEVSFSDGTTASFEISETQAMIGTFSDGSISMRFAEGNGVHSTADGWVIDEPTRGEYQIFRENGDGILEKPSLDDLSDNSIISIETKDIMRGLIVNDESRQDPKQPPQLDGEDSVGISDSVSIYAESEEVRYEKYDLLKQVQEVVSNEPQGATSKTFLQDTLKSIETRSWSDEATEETSELTGDVADESSTDAREETPDVARESSTDAREETPDVARESSTDAREETPDVARESSTDAREETPDVADESPSDAREETPDVARESSTDAREETPDIPRRYQPSAPQTAI